VMVTSRVDGRPWGLTISACCSVSADPPLVLISLGVRTSSRISIIESRNFGLSLLGTHHKPLAEVGARVGAPKFIDGFLEGHGPGDCFAESQAPPGLRSPMVDGALAHLDCALRQSFEVSDHTLLVGEVERAIVSVDPSETPAEPLLYFDRAFRRLGETIE
jgi:flavin reductase ActVB